MTHRYHQWTQGSIPSGDGPHHGGYLISTAFIKDRRYLRDVNTVPGWYGWDVIMTLSGTLPASTVATGYAGMENQAELLDHCLPGHSGLFRVAVERGSYRPGERTSLLKACNGTARAGTPVFNR